MNQEKTVKYAPKCGYLKGSGAVLSMINSDWFDHVRRFKELRLK